MSITLDNVGSGFKRSVINDNFQLIEDELNNETLKKDGSTALTGDLNAGGQEIHNAESISTTSLVVGGVDISDPEQLRGPQGATGDTGPTGPAGIQGPTGPQGPEGVAGPQGLQGIQGIQGPQGVVGPQGADGTSYEVYDTLTITELMGDLTTSIPDNRGYLVESYAPISVGSETNLFLDIKVANGGNTTGTWRCYYNATGVWQDNGAFWNNNQGPLAHWTGAVSGEYVLFTKDDLGASISSGGVEIFYEPAGYAGDYTDLPILYQVSFNKTPVTLDGTFPLATNAIGGYLFIKDGTGTLADESSIFVDTRIAAAYSDPLPFGVGPTGPQGPEGIQGPQGPQGAVGPDGPTGPQGAVGPTGAQGPVGDQGVRGSRAFYTPNQSSWNTAAAISTIPDTPLQYDLSVQYNNSTGYSESRIFGGGNPATLSDWDIVEQLVDNEPTVSGGVAWKWKGVNSFDSSGTSLLLTDWSNLNKASLGQGVLNRWDRLNIVWFEEDASATGVSSAQYPAWTGLDPTIDYPLTNAQYPTISSIRARFMIDIDTVEDDVLMLAGFGASCSNGSTPTNIINPSAMLGIVCRGEELKIRIRDDTNSPIETLVTSSANGNTYTVEIESDGTNHQVSCTANINGLGIVSTQTTSQIDLRQFYGAYLSGAKAGGSKYGSIDIGNLLIEYAG